MMHVLRALLAVLLSAQLLGTLHHQHPIDKAPGDCPACVLGMHGSGGAPPAGAPALPAAAPVPLVAAFRPVPVLRAALSHILPFSQAPPASV